MRGFPLFLLACMAGTAPAADWPQYLGPNRDGIWHETGILQKFPNSGLTQVWKMPIGAGYTGPAVVNGRVYLCDYKLKEQSNLLDQSGFQTPTASGNERVLCLDAKTGKELWKHEYPVTYKRLQYASGPRATPTVDGDRVYTLGAMGDLICLETATGKVLWKKSFLEDFKSRLPIWGFAGAPLVDGDKLISLVGGGDENQLVMAFNKTTGDILWSSQTLTQSDAGYAPPVIYDLAGKRTLVIWHSKGVVGLDPETGKRYWLHPMDVKAALTAPMPRMLPGDRLFLTAFYEGSTMLKITSSETPEVLWKGKGRSEMPDRSETLHSIMPTPFIEGEHIYGVCSYGELRCIKSATGERVWMTRKPTVGTPTDEGKPTRWGNAFLTKQGDRYFLFNEQGELIIARLSPEGYQEIDRTKIIAPSNRMAGRPVVWVSPAFADRKIFIRNDKEVICYSLSE